MEIRLLWTLIRCAHLPSRTHTPITRQSRQRGKSKAVTAPPDSISSPIVFNKQQREAVATLDHLLHAEQFHIPMAEKARYAVLESIYFPRDNTETALRPFTSPLMAFAAMCCLEQHGGAVYAPIFLLPPKLSKMQFSVRLAGFHKLLLKLEQYSSLSEIQKEERRPWFE
jgi:hypothetical protein